MRCTESKIKEVLFWRCTSPIVSSWMAVENIWIFWDKLMSSSMTSAVNWVPSLFNCKMVGLNSRRNVFVSSSFTNGCAVCNFGKLINDNQQSIWLSLDLQTPRRSVCINSLNWTLTLFFNARRLVSHRFLFVWRFQQKATRSATARWRCGQKWSLRTWVTTLSDRPWPELWCYYRTMSDRRNWGMTIMNWDLHVT